MVANCRILCTSLIISLIAVWGFDPIAAEAATPEETVIAYFIALQEGDIKEIKNLLAHDYYQKKSVLLENNKNYSEFLKKYHMSTEFRVLNFVQNGTHASVEVEQGFQDGTRKIVKLILQKDESGDWKIAEEITTH